MIDIKQKIFRYLYNNLKPSDIEKKEEIIKKLFAKRSRSRSKISNYNQRVLPAKSCCPLLLGIFQLLVVTITYITLLLKSLKIDSKASLFYIIHGQIFLHYCNLIIYKKIYITLDYFFKNLQILVDVVVFFIY